MKSPGSVTVVIPVFNEERNLIRLHEELRAVMERLAPLSLEIIFVDDGSMDGSRDTLQQIIQADERCVAVFLKRNYGQTAAMNCGIQMAHGEVIIPMDADLQNDPADIPRLLEKMREGYSCVSGWRKNRKDAAISRKLPSWIANAFISSITGVKLHDYGCSLKAYRADILKEVKLYGDMHRFIPAYAAWIGAKVTEIEVNHRPRVHGVSKYGISRTLKVILDLMVFKYLTVYGTKPIHFFGTVGFVSLLLGVVAEGAALVLRFYGRHLVDTPLPVVGAMFVIVGVQFILFGLLAEVMMRTYYATSGTESYQILSVFSRK